MVTEGGKERKRINDLQWPKSIESHYMKDEASGTLHNDELMQIY